MITVGVDRVVSNSQAFDVGDPAAARVLVRHDPGTDGRVWLARMARAALDRGERVILMTTTTAPRSFLRHAESTGIHLDGGRIVTIDACSGPAALEQNDHLVHDPGNPAAVAAVLQQVAHAHPGAMLLLDSLSGLVDRAGATAFTAMWPDLQAAITRYPAACATWTAWPYPLDEAMLDVTFDAGITMEGIERGVLRSLRAAVVRRDGKPVTQPHWHPILVGPPGGVQIHVPKIVVVGAPDAGKTTFVRSASQQSVGTERGGTTVAIDRGRYTTDDIVADLYGAPGQRRFAPMLEPVLREAVAAVILIDGADPEGIENARDHVRRIKDLGLSCTVGITKDPKAKIPEPQTLDLGADVPVVHLDATDADSARSLLQGLLGRILARRPTA